MKDLCDVIYDPTFFVQTQKYDDQTRTFCTNKGGYVALENYEDFVCVNGHAFRQKKSENTNFAFLSKVVLTEPVTDNQAYGESIGRLASIIGGGKPILQRFGDLKRGVAAPGTDPEGVYRTHHDQCGLRGHRHGIAGTDFEQPHRRA